MTRSTLPARVEGAPAWKANDYLLFFHHSNQEKLAHECNADK
jgi:hypothetical protein